MPKLFIIIGGIVFCSLFLIFILIIKKGMKKNMKKITQRKFRKYKTSQKSVLQKIINAAEVRGWTPEHIKYMQDKNEKNNIDNVAGIYGFFVGDEKISFNEYFIPIYIGKTKNIRSRWIQHVNKIEQAYSGSSRDEIKYQKIAHYLRLKQKSPDCIKFVVIEKINIKDYDKICKERESYWMNLSGSAQRGFNSVKA